MDKKQQTKIVIYALLIIVLGIASYYYYNYLQKQAQDIDTATENLITKKLSSKKLDAEVLKDKKFKELERIKVDESYLNKGTTTATSSASLPEVAKIPRRYSNPFKPF